MKISKNRAHIFLSFFVEAFWSSISQICKSNQLYKRIFKSYGLIDYLSLGQIYTVVFKTPTTSDFDEEWQF